LTDDGIDFYLDEDNSKEKKIANEIIDYGLNKKKLMNEKLKVKKLKIKHKVLMPGNTRSQS
jgi:hypothetical protein